MFGIKLKFLKRSGRFDDLNEAYSSPTFISPLNGVIRGQPVFITIFGSKLKVWMKLLVRFLFGVMAL